ncbi:aldo/keto reductase [Phycisphaera mikurensis]|uniref:Aldo/keto reductase n=1 Tax=Phycisphaera mikurensis (strain NBRC 102666 / KCTC 22515 / FYK2301M01) TaxID=1142394 RepID=I0IDT9_PHYMF|nr:aldo/keto reductase [Phycisphaera mikurensis]MBB6441238.1 aryl-alcohol dehydrogenase-like predicted oxidoreductase [Phycisphaera mikurensis]BAM03427.1 aldo/keto reductase [Phycisphaera mikurensis NBRC 102666]
MRTRSLYTGGPAVPDVGLGCWQIGGGWAGDWDAAAAAGVLAAAYDAGVRFFDTADVYGGGASEEAVGRFVAGRDGCVVATKLGRAAGIFPGGYTEAALRSATEASLDRLGVERLDLTQLHCVPTGVLRRGEVFAWLRKQRDDGLIAAFGASVESVEEGMICLQDGGVSTLQVIFNAFRQDPLDELLATAAAAGVGVIVRLPLASGLLTGKLKQDTAFGAGDHRGFNRDGAAFNVGETFGGIPYERGVELSERFVEITRDAAGTPAQRALRWVLDHHAVSVAIPGASRPAQARGNAAASEMPELGGAVHGRLAALWRDEVAPHVRGPR